LSYFVSLFHYTLQSLPVSLTSCYPLSHSVVPCSILFFVLFCLLLLPVPFYSIICPVLSPVPIFCRSFLFLISGPILFPPVFCFPSPCNLHPCPTFCLPVPVNFLNYFVLTRPILFLFLYLFLLPSVTFSYCISYSPPPPPPQVAIWEQPSKQAVK
jgi:hypothetical protein